MNIDEYRKLTGGGGKGTGKRREKGPGALLQDSIMEWLSYQKDLYFWRNNTGALPISRRDGSQGFIRFGHTGSSDIIVVKKGRFIGIEVKGPTDKIRPAQIGFNNEIKRVGGTIVIATCLQDVIDCIIQI